MTGNYAPVLSRTVISCRTGRSRFAARSCFHCHGFNFLARLAGCLRIRCSQTTRYSYGGCAGGESPADSASCRCARPSSAVQQSRQFQLAICVCGRSRSFRPAPWRGAARPTIDPAHERRHPRFGAGSAVRRACSCRQVPPRISASALHQQPHASARCSLAAPPKSADIITLRRTALHASDRRHSQRSSPGLLRADSDHASTI